MIIAMARFVKFSKTHSKWSSIGKILHNLETFYMFYITFDSRQSLHFYFSLSFSHSNFLSNVWSFYTSVYGGVNFRSQIVHSHLSIDISNYRSGSYNTWVNCHKTPAPHTLSRLLVRITGESSCAIWFDFLNQDPQDVYLWHGIDGAINILFMRDIRDARY